MERDRGSMHYRLPNTTEVHLCPRRIALLIVLSIPHVGIGALPLHGWPEGCALAGAAACTQSQKRGWRIRRLRRLVRELRVDPADAFVHRTKWVVACMFGQLYAWATSSAAHARRVVIHQVLWVCAAPFPLHAYFALRILCDCDTSSACQ